MSLPTIVTRDEWLLARKQLLTKEKEQTRRRDGLNVERRNLPMVKLDKDYAFSGPDGVASLLDLFEGRRQLIVGHFMFDPGAEDGCPSCSQLLSARRRRCLPHLLDVRARGRDARRVLLLAGPNRPRPAGGLGGAQGACEQRARGEPGLLELTCRLPGAVSTRRAPASPIARARTGR